MVNNKTSVKGVNIHRPIQKVHPYIKVLQIISSTISFFFFFPQIFSKIKLIVVFLKSKLPAHPGTYGYQPLPLCTHFITGYWLSLGSALASAGEDVRLG